MAVLESKSESFWRLIDKKAGIKQIATGFALTGGPVFSRLGFTERWRFEKHREDYALGEARVFIDDTTAGVFVEIEATPELIETTAALLGKTPADYILSSYRSLVKP